MGTTADLARLGRLGSSILTTGEVAAALKTSSSSASRTLRTLQSHGLATQLKHGVWRLGNEVPDPRQLSAEITRPYPSYVSFASALSAHEVIDQIPREITLASLGRPKKVRTPYAPFSVHRLPPELFGGFEPRDGFYLATLEKAIFDFSYVAAASGHVRRRLPELDLPKSFSRSQIDRWIKLIRSRRLQTLVRASIDRALQHADLAAAS